MKAFKKATAWTCTLGTLTFLAWGAMNSPVLNKSAFMKNKFNIQFAKRLDEMNGQYKVGRAAASINRTKWSKLKVPAIQKTFKALQAQKPEVAVKIESPKNKPAVTENLELTLTGGLYNKKPLKDKEQFHGSARVAGGIIEEVIVGLPGGEEIAINTTNERMNGNVFSYEDSQTSELKSGLLYKVKQGVYMVTLTNDSAYPGLRLEFKTQAQVDQSHQKQNQNWAADSYNKDSGIDSYAQNTNVKEVNDYPADTYSNSESQSYSF